MRLLVTSYEFPPVGGGGGQVARAIARRLAAGGDEVDVVTMGCRGLPRVERHPNLTVHRVPGRRRHLSGCTAPEAAIHVLAALPVVIRLARARRYDLIHSHFILPDGFLGLVAARFARAPLVITAHGTDVPGHNPSRVGLLHRLMSPVWRLATSRAAALVCPSRMLQARVVAANPGARTTVIPNGADAGRFDPSVPKTRRILAVSRMVPTKGMQYLMRALHGFESDYEVTLVGDGPCRPELAKLAADLSVRTRFTGWLDSDGEQLRRLYETSDIFVFPSEVENCPLALLDAMAAGMAIVTTRDTGCEAVVRGSAILVPPRNPEAIRAALERLVQSPALVRELGSRARARLEQGFGWNTVAQRYRELFEIHARGS